MGHPGELWQLERRRLRSSRQRQADGLQQRQGPPREPGRLDHPDDGIRPDA